MKVELELVEIYRYEGLPGVKYRFRVKDTKIYLNVTATSLEEATKKAEQIIKNLELDKYLASIERSR
uniref:Uncharacterized protein n=1 Tax=Ignisphaera aggregans TaxID=334771 RepID=A0A7J2U2W7_9CREN